jgi:hypothetical protein
MSKIEYWIKVDEDRLISIKLRGKLVVDRQSMFVVQKFIEAVADSIDKTTEDNIDKTAAKTFCFEMLDNVKRAWRETF